MGLQPDGREHLTWEDFGGAGIALAKQVHADGFQPDIILAIARGGLFVAGALAYSLGVKNLHLMNVEYYTGEDTRREFPVILPPPLSLVDISEKTVLVADDVADTGHTLKLVCEFCQDHVREVRTAVLYEKPHSEVRCEYVWRRTAKWIVFPWSKDPPITGAEAEQRAVTTEH